MKVLYIGHFSEGSGWSDAATNYALALDSVGVDVVCRSVKLNGNNPSHPRVAKLEEKSANGCDVCIQHVLPHLMHCRTDIKNVGMAIIETDTTRPSGWFKKLSLMDDVWTPNSEAAKFLLDDGLKSVWIIPHCVNPDKYNNIEDISLPGLDHSFIFYYIGEFNRRKRLAAIINSFHNEFDRTEPVALVIKTSSPNMSPEQTHQAVKNMADTVKSQLHKYKDPHYYKPEYVITDRLSEGQIMGLHKMGHCFVNSSFGEAWGMPCFDAYAMGNAVVSSNCGGPRDYLPPHMLVGGDYEPCIGGDVIFPSFNTSREKWFSININKLQKGMRYAYNAGLPEKPNINRWSYETVGQLMKDRLLEF